MIKVHSDLGPYVCCKCTKTFKTDLVLYHHDKRVYQTVPEVYQIRIHFKRVHGKNMFPCTFCDKILKSMNILKRHIQIVHIKIQMKSFECDGCTRAFHSWQDIQIFSCTSCDKNVRSRYSLKHFKIAKGCPKYILSVVEVSSCSYQTTFC